jgi:hypothetical protein
MPHSSAPAQAGRTVPSVLTGEHPMIKQQRRPSRPPPEHLQESVSTLRDAAKDLVLDAARLWRGQKGSAWTEHVLASVLDILVRTEVVLGEVLEGEPARH